MTRYAAFVRAVMIGREGLHRQVLLDIATAAGAVGARSYISTGNLTFDLDERDLDDWIAATEAGVEGVVGRRTEVFVRSIEQLRALDLARVFADAPFDDVQAHEVSFLSEPLATPPSLPIWGRREEVVVFAATDREAFAVNRLVGGRTSGAGGLVERSLGQRVTTRGWSTIERILRSPDSCIPDSCSPDSCSPDS